MTSVEWYAGNHNKGSIIFSENTTIRDLRKLLGKEANIPFLATRLVLIVDDQHFYAQTNDFALVIAGKYFVTGVEQVLVVVGDLESRLAKRFERLLDVPIPCGSRIEKETCTYHDRERKIYKVLRLVVLRPFLLNFRDSIMDIVTQAATTAIIILCHSLKSEGLLLGDGVVPVVAFSAIAPDSAQYNVFLNTETCFAANHGYHRVLVEGGSTPLLAALQNIGGTGQKIRAVDAVQSVAKVLEKNGFPCSPTALNQLDDDDFDFYLEKWAWPHTIDKDTRTRVLEQFGETFHIAVLVALYPSLLGKFKKPKVDNELYDGAMNFQQFQCLESIQEFAVQTRSPVLINNESVTLLSQQDRYSHSDGSALVCMISQRKGFLYENVLSRIRRRLATGDEATDVPSCKRYTLLVVRTSTAGGCTNSAVRDMPSKFIIEFLKANHDVVIVGNPLPIEVMNDIDLSVRQDILIHTEAWLLAGQGENKYLFQIRFYNNLRIRYNIDCGLGMWSGALDMFALLGIRIVRLYVSVSCVARIKNWSAALGLPFCCFPFKNDEKSRSTVIEAFTKFKSLGDVVVM